MASSLPTPRTVVSNHALQVYRERKVAEVLNLSTIREHREVVYTSESK